MSKPIVRLLLLAALAVGAAAALAQVGPQDQKIEAAIKALATAEHAFGGSDRRLVSPLTALGRLYETDRRYAEAEVQYRRALAILEKAGAVPGEEASQIKLSLLSVAAKQALHRESAAAGRSF